jgi:hypothetical protein
MSHATVVFRNGNQGSIDGESGKGAGSGGSVVDRVDDRQRSLRQMESSGSCVGRFGNSEHVGLSLYPFGGEDVQGSGTGSGSGSGMKTGGRGNGVGGSGSSSWYLAGSRCRRARQPLGRGGSRLGKRAISGDAFAISS